jgi:hypothetical protein
MPIIAKINILLYMMSVLSKDILFPSLVLKSRLLLSSGLVFLIFLSHCCISGVSSQKGSRKKTAGY